MCSAQREPPTPRGDNHLSLCPPLSLLHVMSYVRHNVLVGVIDKEKDRERGRAKEAMVNGEIKLWASEKDGRVM